MKIIHERFPYRFTENGLLETNGQPDYRIQKWNEITDRYRDMFYLDSAIQLDMALEDREYVKWLAPDPAVCLLYTSPIPRDQRGARMPSSA